MSPVRAYPLQLKSVFTSIAGAAVVLSFLFASAASALTASCVGTPAATSVTWTASSTGGVPPIAFLWGNGSTSSVQTVMVSPGFYSMTLQAIDASSTVATTTCATTVAQPAPSVTSFIATPVSITSGQSSVLSWVVLNASSTSLDNGIGAVSSTSMTVTPSVTTTYHLSAVNPSGTTTASAIVTVNATSTGNTIAQQIQNLLNQIAALKAQIIQLLQQQSGGTPPPTSTSTPPTVGCNFNRDLSEGDNGDDVKGLQLTLSSDSSIFPPGLITGFFGKRTQEALKKFQKKFGIFSVGSTTTGFFGPKTRGFLKQHCGENDSRNSTSTSTGQHEDSNVSTSTSSNDGEHQDSKTSTSTKSGGWYGNNYNGENGKGNNHGD